MLILYDFGCTVFVAYCDFFVISLFVATWVALRNLAYILRFVILLNVQHRFPVDGYANI